MRKQKEKYVSQKQDGSPARDGESKEGRSKRKNRAWKRESRARQRLLLTSLGGDDEVAEEEEEEDEDAEKEDEEDEAEN